MLDKTNVYLKVAEGFKAGGINAEAPTPFESLKPYSPETIESTELGLKGRYFDNRMMLNVAYFDKFNQADKDKWIKRSEEVGHPEQVIFRLGWNRRKQERYKWEDFDY